MVTTRERLLEAASELVDQRERAGFTVDAVAAAAGVSRATAYRVFGSAADMAAEVAIHRLDVHRAGLLEIERTEPDTLARLEAMVVYTQLKVLNDPGMQRLLSGGHVSGMPQMLAFAREFLVPLFASGQARGEIRTDVDTEEMTDWLVETLLDAAAHGHDEHTMVRRFRLFICPALLVSAPSGAALATLTRTENHLRSALGLVSQLRGTPT